MWLSNDLDTIHFVLDKKGWGKRSKDEAGNEINEEDTKNVIPISQRHLKSLSSKLKNAKKIDLNVLNSTQRQLSELRRLRNENWDDDDVRSRAQIVRKSILSNLVLNKDGSGKKLSKRKKHKKKINKKKKEENKKLQIRSEHRLDGLNKKQKILGPMLNGSYKRGPYNKPFYKGHGRYDRQSMFGGGFGGGFRGGVGIPSRFGRAGYSRRAGGRSYERRPKEDGNKPGPGPGPVNKISIPLNININNKKDPETNLADPITIKDEPNDKDLKFDILHNMISDVQDRINNDFARQVNANYFSRQQDRNNRPQSRQSQRSQYGAQVINVNDFDNDNDYRHFPFDRISTSSPLRISPINATDEEVQFNELPVNRKPKSISETSGIGSLSSNQLRDQQQAMNVFSVVDNYKSYFKTGMLPSDKEIGEFIETKNWQSPSFRHKGYSDNGNKYILPEKGYELVDYLFEKSPAARQNWSKNNAMFQYRLARKMKNIAPIVEDDEDLNDSFKVAEERNRFDAWHQRLLNSGVNFESGAAIQDLISENNNEWENFDFQPNKAKIAKTALKLLQRQDNESSTDLNDDDEMPNLTREELEWDLHDVFNKDGMGKTEIDDMLDEIDDDSIGIFDDLLNLGDIDDVDTNDRCFLIKRKAYNQENLSRYILKGYDMSNMISRSFVKALPNNKDVINTRNRLKYVESDTVQNKWNKLLTNGIPLYMDGNGVRLGNLDLPSPITKYIGGFSDDKATMPWDVDLLRIFESTSLRPLSIRSILPSKEGYYMLGIYRLNDISRIMDDL